MRNNFSIIIIAILAFLVFCCPLTIMGLALTSSYEEASQAEEENTQEDETRYTPEYKPNE